MGICTREAARLQPALCELVKAGPLTAAGKADEDRRLSPTTFTHRKASLCCQGLMRADNVDKSEA